MSLGIFKDCRSELTPVSIAERAAIAARPRTGENHQAAFDAAACMREIRVGCHAPKSKFEFPLTVAAWNLERCLMPEDSAALLASEGAELVLLSEMDAGMARTGQRDTTEALSRALDMAFAYGVEFLELTLGAEKEREFVADEENALGYHGNAIASAVPLEAPALIRLDDDSRWYRMGTAEQGRIGGRIAIAVVVATSAGPMLAVSTHLESNSLEDFRALQMGRLLDAIDELADGMPIILGGDMNTGNKMPDADWRAESLFGLTEERGYAVHGGDAEAATTRPSLITTAPPRRMKLDWFFTRGLDVTASRIVPALRADATPLSDHELMICEIAGFL